MRIGLFAPLINPENDAAYLAALARGAEERGFHAIWLGEHVVLVDDYAAPSCSPRHLHVDGWGRESGPSIPPAAHALNCRVPPKSISSS